MSRFLLTCLSCLLLCGLLLGQAEAPSAEGSLLIRQQQLVAALTGYAPTTGDITLSSRWSAPERAISRVCIRAYFTDLGISLQEQAYQMPNVHAFQDLLLGPFEGANLYGILPSTRPSDEYLILGAHYDTERFAPGANDNASAIAAIYGVVETVSAATQRDRNLMIVFFDQEEEGNVGSRAFIKYLRTQPWRIQSVHTIDQLGWDKDGDRAIELELPAAELAEAYKGAGAALSLTVHTTRVNASDHQAFRAAGYVVTGITEEFANGDTSPFKDTAKDTYDTVDFRYVESTTRLLSRVLLQLIND